ATADIRRVKSGSLALQLARRGRVRFTRPVNLAAPKKSALRLPARTRPAGAREKGQAVQFPLRKPLIICSSELFMIGVGVKVSNSMMRASTAINLRPRVISGYSGTIGCRIPVIRKTTAHSSQPSQRYRLRGIKIRIVTVEIV